MSPEKIAQLFDRFEAIRSAHSSDQIVASRLVMREMHAAGVSWLDLLLEMHEQLASARARESAKGALLTGGTILTEIAPEDQRRAAFIAAVMRPILFTASAPGSNI